MGARENILQKIRRATVDKGVGETNGEDRQSEVAARLADAPKGVIPARGQLKTSDRIDLFEQMATNVSASVKRVASYNDVAAEVTRYLREKNLPASVRMGNNHALAQVPWDNEKTLEIRRGPSDGTDLAGLSHAFAGIAETGTVALNSGPLDPTTINFLPEHHLVVVRTEDITGDLESVWGMLRTKVGKGKMPRTINLVTGPSRSGDIEQTILLGAHGPRALHLIIVDE